MCQNHFYRLGHVSVLDLVGADAEAIAHTLTTNEVKSLQVGQGRETFVTDVKGKALGHGSFFRTEDGLRFIGAAGQSERLAAHADRYIIREDCQLMIRDAEFVAVALPDSDCIGLAELCHQAHADSITTTIGSSPASVHGVRWTGNQSCVALLAADAAESAIQSLSVSGKTELDSEAFHRDRVSFGYPWYGADLDEKNLPQEADRDDSAISFTKGCYLGQETIARLDALGQVQRKLVRWQIDGDLPAAGATLDADGKTVGRLTSIVMFDDGRCEAIGFARRSHFVPGAAAEGEGFTGTVLAS